MAHRNVRNAIPSRSVSTQIKIGPGLTMSTPVITNKAFLQAFLKTTIAIECHTKGWPVYTELCLHYCRTVDHNLQLQGQLATRD